jgi:hypothetical protein
MHQLLVAFFAMLFSIAQPTKAHPNDAFVASAHPFIHDSYSPTREQLAHDDFAMTTSYAESSCVSCRRMNVEYSER